MNLASAFHPSVFALLLLASPPLAAADGAPDPAFGTNGAIRIAWDYGGTGTNDDYAEDIVGDNSGTLFVVGYISSESGDYDWAIAKIDPAGAVTKKRFFFDKGGAYDDEADAALLDGAGHLLVAGSVDTNTGRDLYLCRFSTSDLTLDTSFGSSGCGVFSSVSTPYLDARSLARAANGGFLVGGMYGDGSASDIAVFEFDSTGSPGAASPANESSAEDYGGSLIVDINGEPLIGGARADVTYGHVSEVVKFTTLGDFDYGFGTGGKVVVSDPNGPSFATALAVEPWSGTNFLAAFYTDNGDSTTTTTLDRLAGDGYFLAFQGSLAWSTDVTWSASATNYVRKVLLQSDRKMFVIGDTAGGVFYETTRLNVDGDPDPDFGTNGTRSYEPLHVATPTGHGVVSATLSGGRPVLLGDVVQSNRDWLVVRLTNSLIFTDGFESGDLRLWSSNACGCAG